MRHSLRNSSTATMSAIFSRKVFIFLSAILLLCMISGGFFVFFRVNRQKELLKTMRWAMSHGNFDVAAKVLKELEIQSPNLPFAVASRASLLAFARNPMAISAWQEAVRLDPDNEEYRVAGILSCLDLGNVTLAQSFLDNWPEEKRSSNAYDRAALAIAFTKSDWATAEYHASRLAAAQPNSLPAKMNLAKVRLYGPEAESARHELNALAAQPDTALEASHALLNNAIHRKDTDTVRRLSGDLLRQTSSNHAGFLMALEALTRIGAPPPEETVRTVWLSCKPSPPSLARLIAWLNSVNRRELLWTLAENHPTDDLWSFPTGFALAEALNSPQRLAVALTKIESTPWPSAEHLRSFTLARLQWGTTEAEKNLRNAIHQALQRQNGISDLLHVAETWRWEAGIVAALEQRVLTQKPTAKEIAALYAFLENRGDTKAMLRISLRHRELEPDNPVVQNNAAYFCYLCNVQLAEATLWAQQAATLLPKSAEIASTLALLLVRFGDLEGAKKVLHPFPENGPAAWPLAEIRLAERQEIAESLKNALRALPKYYPEERERLDLLLSSGPMRDKEIHHSD